LLGCHVDLEPNCTERIRIISKADSPNQDASFFAAFEVIDARSSVDLPESEGPRRTIFSLARTIKLIV
jgi:hypothetical protein